MNLKKLFGKSDSATIARDRLTIMLAHERSVKVPYMEQMKEEIIAVVRKYTNTDKIAIRADSNQDISTLEVQITLD